MAWYTCTSGTPSAVAVDNIIYSERTGVVYLTRPTRLSKTLLITLFYIHYSVGENHIILYYNMSRYVNVQKDEELRHKIILIASYYRNYKHIKVIILVDAFRTII